MSARTSLFTFGRKRKPDYVRGIRETVDGASKIRVLWTQGERLRTESFADTRKGLAEAKAFAEGVHESLHTRAPSAPEPVTLRGLLEKHITAKDSEWAPNTLRLLRWRWGKLELHAGRSTFAHLITREVLDALKGALIETHAPNQVRLAIKTVTSVFRWGVDRDLIPPTKVTTYVAKFSKEIERRAPKMEEYSADHRDKVLAQLDPRDAKQWRAWVLTTLFGYCGPRQTAARALEWADVDFDRGLIHWRAETDKVGTERWQPMPAPVRDALWVAYGWRRAIGYSGKFVTPRAGAGLIDAGNGGYVTARSRARVAARADQPYGYAAYNRALHEAEKRAGLTPVKFKAAHAFRRGAAGNVHSLTGSTKAAADWIGDKSVKVVEKHYLLERQEELRRTAGLLSPSLSSELKPYETLQPRQDGEAVSSEPSMEGDNV